MYKWLLILGSLVVLMLPAKVGAHRSGCHAWHSCPSDSGSYVCGDTGHSNYCGGYSGPVITSRTIYDDTAIPFQTVYQDNPSVQNGVAKVLTAGINGALRKYYQATYSDGVYQSKYWTRDETISQPINEVVERGTAPASQVLAESVNNPKKNYGGWWVTAGIIGLVLGASWLFGKNKQN